MKRLAEAIRDTSTAQTDLYLATDVDDPGSVYGAMAAGAALGDRVRHMCGQRQTLSAWTNQIALAQAGNYRALASLGDDHVPRTPGWDRLLLDAIDGMGGTGFAYGDDLGQRENLATSVMVSADIVQALGWFMLPACAHYHVDNAWMDLGRGAGCLAWCPDVVIEHAHPFWGAAPMDATYESEFGRGGADQAAYEKWLASGRDGDVATVRSLRQAP
jgi:hypothetical protein